MPFVKIDCGILRSTLWFEREAREVFLTALLMATPKEIQSEMQTFAVDTAKPEKFKVPPGWYGFVEAAGVGIIRFAGVNNKDGMAALKKLTSPEADSRSPDFEGRRMARVDGGFVILNFMKYRDRDYTARDRQKRWRERNAVTSSNNAVTDRNITQAEAEAEAYKKKDLVAAFEKLWDEYPRREGKKQSLRHFLSSVKTSSDLSKIRTALGNYKAKLLAEKTEPRFVKMGSTWFNDWESFVDMKPPEKPKPTTQHSTAKPDHLK